MSRRARTRLYLALSVLVLLAPPAAAAEPNIATLRVTSLDAVLNDLETLATALGVPMERDEALTDAMAPLQFPGVALLDRTRPAAVVFPVRGMLLGAQALVTVLPVRDTEAALLLIEDRFETHGVNGSIHTFSRADGPDTIVRVEEGYLIVGLDPDAVSGLDLAAALAGGDMPPGNISLDILLEQVAPLVQAGLMQGRQMIEMQMEAQAAGEDEAGAEEPAAPGPEEEGAAEPEGVEPEEDAGEGAEAEITVQPEIDPQAVVPMLDVYFDLLRDALNNVSRVQISVEVSPGNLLFHKRVFPLAGSTLAGLIAAQSGGLPDLARLVDPTDAFLVLAGQVTRTPEFDAALAGYGTRYMDAVRGLIASMPDEPLVGQYTALMDSMTPLIAEGLRCYGGDVAAAIAIDEEGGLRATQVMGARDEEACRSMLTHAAEMINAIPAGPDGERVFSVTENALTYGGASAYRQETRALLPLVDQPDREEAAEFMRKFLGGDRLVAYWGMTGGLLVGTMGTQAEQAFKDVVDRGDGAAKGGGVSASTFAPLEMGPGIFATMDLGAMFERLAAMREDVGVATMPTLLAGGFGRMVYGARFGAGNLQFDVALPLEMLASWAELARSKAAEMEQEVEELEEDPAEDFSPEE